MAVLIRGETLYVAWLGDSQVVLSKAGQPCLLMNPHKPNREVTNIKVVSFGNFMGICCVTGFFECEVKENYYLYHAKQNKT